MTKSSHTLLTLRHKTRIMRTTATDQGLNDTFHHTWHYVIISIFYNPFHHGQTNHYLHIRYWESDHLHKASHSRRYSNHRPLIPSKGHVSVHFSIKKAIPTAKISTFLVLMHPPKCYIEATGSSSNAGQRDFATPALVWRFYSTTDLHSMTIADSKLHLFSNSSVLHTYTQIQAPLLNNAE